MENFESSLNKLEKDKEKLVMEINKLKEVDIIKLSKTLGYINVKGSEEALKFVIESIKEAKDQDDLQTIQRKYHNLDEIEI